MVTINRNAKDVAQVIVTNLKRSGWADGAIKGVIANAVFESGLNPMATNASGHKGLWQWSAENDIHMSFEQTDIEQQINYMRDRSEQWSGRYNWDRFATNTDPQQATNDFNEYWERSGESTNRWTTATSNWLGIGQSQSPQDAFNIGILKDLEWNGGGDNNRQRIEVIRWPLRSDTVEYQAPFNNYSHLNEAAFDIGDGQIGGDITSPFTGYFIDFQQGFNGYGAFYILSKWPLKWADGSVSYGLFFSIHNVNLRPKNGELVPRGKVIANIGSQVGFGGTGDFVKHSHQLFAKVKKEDLQTWGNADTSRVIIAGYLMGTSNPGGTSASVIGSGGHGNHVPYRSSGETVDDNKSDTVLSWMTSNNSISMVEGDFSHFTPQARDNWKITGFKDTTGGDVDNTDSTEFGDAWELYEQGSITAIFDGYKDWRGF